MFFKFKRKELLSSNEGDTFPEEGGCLFVEFMRRKVLSEISTGFFEYMVLNDEYTVD